MLKKLIIVWVVFLNCIIAGDRKSIAVIGGTGSIGGYFASKLAGDMSVAIVGREGSPHLKKIQEESLVIKTTKGSLSSPPSKFSFIGGHPKEIPFQPDIILLTLKQPDVTEELAEQLLSISTPDTLILFTGNGIPFFFLQGLKTKKTHVDAVDPKGSISRLFASRSLAFLHPVIAAEIESDGVIKVSREEDEIKVTLATVWGNSASGDLKQLNTLLNNAGVATHVEEGQAQRIVLEKLQFSLSVNILSGLLNRSLDDVFYDPKLQPFLEYIATLVQNIGANLGIQNVRSYKQFSKNTGLTRGHFSSFWHDLKTGKTPENKAIVDAAIELGRYVNSQTIQNQLNLTPLLKLKELVDKRIDGGSISEEDIVRLCPVKAKL